MPINVYGVSEDSQVQSPVSGEQGSAALLIRYLTQPLSNKIEFVRSLVNDTRNQILGLNSPHIIGINLDCGGALVNWQRFYDDASSRTAWRQINSAVDARQLQFEITPWLPTVGKITEIGGEVMAAPSHTGFPALSDRPWMEIRRVFRQHVRSVPGDPFLAVSDQSPSLAYYESWHPIASSSLTSPTPVPIDTLGYRYYLRVYGEAGAFYKDGFTVNGLYIKVRL